MSNRRRDKTEKRKITKNVREQKSIIEYIVTHKDTLSIILALWATLYPVVNTVYKMLYQRECEKFYSVPGKYFDTTVNESLLYLGCVIMLVLIGAVPIFIKKSCEKNEDLSRIGLAEAIFFSIMIGMEMGIFNVFNLVEIMKQTHKTNVFFRIINNWLIDNSYFTIIVVVVLGSIAILGITLMDRLKNIKWKWIRKVVSVVLAGSLVASILIMLYGTVFKLSISIDDKRKYEFVTYDKEYVVLSSYNEKILIVPYEIDESGQYIFKTSQYSFAEPADGTFRYIDIKHSPDMHVDVKGDK